MVISTQYIENEKVLLQRGWDWTEESYFPNNFTFVKSPVKEWTEQLVPTVKINQVDMRCTLSNHLVVGVSFTLFSYPLYLCE